MFDKNDCASNVHTVDSLIEAVARKKIAAIEIEWYGGSTDNDMLSDPEIWGIDISNSNNARICFDSIGVDLEICSDGSVKSELSYGAFSFVMDPEDPDSNEQEKRLACIIENGFIVDSIRLYGSDGELIGKLSNNVCEPIYIYNEKSHRLDQVSQGPVGSCGSYCDVCTSDRHCYLKKLFEISGLL